MPEWRELYVAKSLGDLKKKAEAGFNYSKMKEVFRKNGEVSFVKTMDKLYVSYQQYKKQGDQENCYINLLKFFQCFSFIQKESTDKKYLSIYFGKKTAACLDELEDLDTQLRARYSELEDKKNDDDDVKQKKIKNDDVDFRSQIIANSDDKQITKRGDIFINCKELKELIHSSNPLSVLIMDVRSEEEFQSRVKCNNIINIPNKIVFPGVSAAKLEQKLPEESKDLWKRRGEFENIVIMDSDTDADKFKSKKNAVYSMRIILTEWDFPNVCKNPPLVLNEGFYAWEEMYPNFTVNPGFCKIFKNITAITATVPLSQIEYPDSDEETKKQEEIIPKVHPKENIPSQPIQTIVTKPATPELTPAVPHFDRSSKPKLESKNSLDKTIPRKPLMRSIHDSPEWSDGDEPVKNNLGPKLESKNSLDKTTPRKPVMRSTHDSSEWYMTNGDEPVKNNMMVDDVSNDVKKTSARPPSPDSNSLSSDKENFKPINGENINGSAREHWKADSEIKYVGLKSDSNSAGSPGLKKSLSSPNITKLNDNMEVLLPKTTPMFDRSNKPSYLTPLDSPRHGYQDKQYRVPSQGELEGAVMGANIVRGLTGLKNLGNSCYMNSILQCISNTTVLREELCRFSAGERLKNHKSKTEGLIAREIQKVIRILWLGNVKYFACYDLKSVVGKFRNSFKGSEQQDSHEFFTILMDWLHEDLNEPSPNGELLGAVEESGEKAWGEFKKNNNSIVLDLFYGQQKSTVRCNKCGEQSVTFEPFSNLSLLLPSNEDSCTLSDCLELYLKQECISGWNCPKCKTPQNATKKVDITRLPPVLVIHFKRFTSNGWCRKKQTYVNFPLSRFDMKGYTAKGSEQRNEVYNLYAVSNHYGTMESGHYTAYCLNTEVNRWFKFDDQDVSDISPNDVKTSAAYILFYGVKRYS